VFEVLAKPTQPLSIANPTSGIQWWICSAASFVNVDIPSDDGDKSRISDRFAKISLTLAQHQKQPRLHSANGYTLPNKVWDIRECLGGYLSIPEQLDFIGDIQTLHGLRFTGLLGIAG